ncbi:MAG TPA: hypothetical protein VGD71_43975 [Kribbella sp.]|jgi:hypothetical protein
MTKAQWAIALLSGVISMAMAGFGGWVALAGVPLVQTRNALEEQREAFPHLRRLRGSRRDYANAMALVLADS